MNVRFAGDIFMSCEHILDYRMNYCIMKKVAVVMIKVVLVVVVVAAAAVVAVVAVMTVLSHRSLNLEVTDFFLWGHVNYGLPRPQGTNQHSTGREV
jgi:hypothetical protein